MPAATVAGNMNTTSSLPDIPADQLAAITGGGAIATIASLFGDKAAKWGGIAEQVIGLFKGGGSQPAADGQ